MGVVTSIAQALEEGLSKASRALDGSPSVVKKATTVADEQQAALKGAMDIQSSLSPAVKSVGQQVPVASTPAKAGNMALEAPARGLGETIDQKVGESLDYDNMDVEGMLEPLPSRTTNVSDETLDATVNGNKVVPVVEQPVAVVDYALKNTEPRYMQLGDITEDNVSLVLDVFLSEKYPGFSDSFVSSIKKDYMDDFDMWPGDVTKKVPKWMNEAVEQSREKALALSNEAKIVPPNNADVIKDTRKHEIELMKKLDDIYKVGRLNNDAVKPDIAGYSKVFFEELGTKPYDTDIAKIHSLWVGNGPRKSLTPLEDIRASLRAGKAVREAAGDTLPTDGSILTVGDNIPVIIWRGTNLDVELKAPIDSLTHNLNNPKEISVHAGTANQAQSFAEPQWYQINKAIRANNRSKLRNEISDFLEGQLIGDVPTRDAIYRRMGDGPAWKNMMAATEEYFRWATGTSNEADMLSRIGADFIVDSGSHGIKEKEALIDEILVHFEGMLREPSKSDSVIDAGDIPQILAAYKDNLQQGLHTGRYAKATVPPDSTLHPHAQHAQMVPFVLKSNKYLVQGDVGFNSSDEVAAGALNRMDSFQGDKDEWRKVVDLYSDGIVGVKEPVERNKVMQKILRDRGYGAVIYANNAEGTNRQLSFTVVDESNIITLDKLIPSIQKLTDALKRKVFVLLGLGMTVEEAVKFVQEGEEDNGV